MAPHSLRYLANCSLLFTELPLLDRPAAAKTAGFDAIEFWWPFATPTPDQDEIDRFTTAIEKADVQLVALNYYAGDVAGPDCGVLSIPDRAQEFRDSVTIATSIGGRLGVTAFNALYGNRVDAVNPEEQDLVATESLQFAADAAAELGATVLIEPISGPKPYPLRSAADAVRVVDRLRARDRGNVGLLFDLYHLAANGENLSEAIAEFSPWIAHVQIADFPGRGEPGSGILDIPHYLAQLEAAGYGGWVGLEYKPSAGDTAASLEWLSRKP